MTTDQQEHYEECLRRGTSPALAEMFALGQPPMSNTDREFLEGRCNGNQFSGQPWVGDLYKREALAAGVNPVGKIYMASLATYPGDPGAWVSGRGDIQRRCELHGWGADGTVNLPVRAVAERSDGRLADDIVENKVQEILDVTPEASRVDTEDLREQVREKMSPHWTK